MYCIAEIGGNQMWLELGRIYNTKYIAAKPGHTINFNRILLYKEAGKITIGQPYLKNIVASGTILNHDKKNKIIVYKMKPKKKMRKTIGYRQSTTRFVVTKLLSKND